MKILAKCKLCGNVVESREGDIVACECGEIVLKGSTREIICRTSIVNYEEVKSIDEVDQVNDEIISLEERLDMLREMIKNYERLPQHALMQPITHYDLLSVMILMESIMRE